MRRRELVAVWIQVRLIVHRRSEIGKIIATISSGVRRFSFRDIIRMRFLVDLSAALMCLSMFSFSSFSFCSCFFILNQDKHCQFIKWKCLLFFCDFIFDMFQPIFISFLE